MIRQLYKYWVWLGMLCTGCVYIVPLPEPTAEFEVVPSETGKFLVPCEVAVDNNSNIATRFEWNPGNGKTYYERDPVFLYLDTGTFEIELKATNGDDESDYTTRTVRIGDSGEALDRSDWAGDWEVVAVELSSPSQRSVPGFPFERFELVENRYLATYSNNQSSYGELTDLGDSFHFGRIGVVDYSLSADAGILELTIDGYVYQLTRTDTELPSDYEHSVLTHTVWKTIEIAGAVNTSEEFTFFPSGRFVHLEPSENGVVVERSTWSLEGSTLTAMNETYQISRLIATSLHLEHSSGTIKTVIEYVP